MNSILLNILELVIIFMAILLARYIVPQVKASMAAEQLAVAAEWAEYAVKKAEQVMKKSDGAHRKAYVTEFLKRILMEKDMALSDEQIDVLIESAVKQMKMDMENS